MLTFHLYSFYLDRSYPTDRSVVCLSVYLFRLEVSTFCLPQLFTIFLVRVPLTPSSVHQLARRVGQGSPRYACLCIPPWGYRPEWLSQTLYMEYGYKFRSLWLCSKHFTHWVIIIPALVSLSCMYSWKPKRLILLVRSICTESEEELFETEIEKYPQWQGQGLERR